MKKSAEVVMHRMMTKNICPRCEGLVPNNEQWGEYPGAVSRNSRSIQGDSIVWMVCSPCGQEEALEDFAGVGATPAEQWPVLTPEAMYRRSVAFEILSQFKDGDWETPF